MTSRTFGDFLTPLPSVKKMTCFTWAFILSQKCKPPLPTCETTLISQLFRPVKTVNTHFYFPSGKKEAVHKWRHTTMKIYRPHPFSCVTSFKNVLKNCWVFRSRLIWNLKRRIECFCMMFDQKNSENINSRV